MKSFNNALLTLVSQPGDHKEDKIIKLLLIGGHVGGILYAFVTGLLYFLNALYIPAIIVCIYIVPGVLAVLYYLQTKKFQIAGLFLAIFLCVMVIGLHITMGGFEGSGVVLIWIAACSMNGIATNQPKLTVMWMVIFIIAVSIFSIIDPVLAKSSHGVTEQFSRLIFALNFGFGLIYLNGITYIFMHIVNISRRRADDLLLNILPASVAERLKIEPGTIANRFDDVTVLFADIVDFTKLSAKADPVEIVNLLNLVFSDFDDLAEKFGLEKIKTIGDAYMVVGGLPEPRPDHCEAVAEFGIEMLKAISKHTVWDNQMINLRVGICTGQAVAGVIGKRKFSYDLWGDTVNTASRMESNGIPNVIQVTKEVKDRLSEKYTFIERDPIYVKGKGEMVTYILSPA